MAELGYIGLGVMGGRIAKRLLDAGHTVTGYNRTKSKAAWLIEAGMKWAESPQQVAAQAEVTFSMVTSTEAVRAIAEGPEGVLEGLSEGKIYVDMSTASPANTRALATKAAAKGAQMLDAPVSGSVSTLEEGRLSIMVGGDKAAFEKILPILQDIGPTVTHVGEAGLAVSMKIATNLGLAVQMLALCESILLAEKSGIERETALEVLVNSVVASPMVKYRGPFVLGMPEEAWFDVNMMQKDLMLALEMGRQLEVPLPTTSVANEFMTAARGMGMATEDFAVVFRVLAGMSGVDA